MKYIIDLLNQECIALKTLKIHIKMYVLKVIEVYFFFKSRKEFHICSEWKKTTTNKNCIYMLIIKLIMEKIYDE